MFHVLGRILNKKYRIMRQLGDGSMGSVYHGVDLEAAQDVAIKIMHPELMKEPGMLTRFRREARAMRRARHPNVVRVLDHGVDRGLAFLVMELLHGESLGEHITREGCMAPERAVHIVEDICDALSVVHACGFIHRDIKPENIMLTGISGMFVKLIDFGLVKPPSVPSVPSVSAEDDEDEEVTLPNLQRDSLCSEDELYDKLELTRTGTVVGSAGYMPPEQWAGGEIDARTDVYACGALLYQLVTGLVPFDDQDMFRIVTRQLVEQPEPPHTLNHEVPVALSRIILRALLPAPGERYATICELRDALRAYALQEASRLPMITTWPAPASAAAKVSERPAVPVFELPLIPRGSLRLPPLSVRFPEVSERAPLVSIDPEPPAESEAAPITTRRPLAASVYARGLLPFAAAFLTLGLILGVLFFLPGSLR